MTQTAAILRTAEREIQRVLDSLDPGAHPCGACGLTLYNDREAQLAADALRGAIGRVRKARRLLNTGPERAQGEDS